MHVTASYMKELESGAILSATSYNSTLNNAVRFINGVENVRLASVILVDKTYLLKRKGNIVNVGQSHGDLKSKKHVNHNHSTYGGGHMNTYTLAIRSSLKSSTTHLVHGLLYGRAVNALVSGARKGLDEDGFNVLVDGNEVIFLSQASRIISPFGINRGCH